MTEIITDRYALYNGDCVEVAAQLPTGSVHFEIFSPPFANLYIYSDDLRDMGNCKDVDEFFYHHGFLTPHLYRILMPGRLCAVHCKQLARYKGRDGAAGWYDFRGDIIRHFESHGFQYHSEVVIWTDPVLEMQKTKTQRLLFCNLQKDASVTGVGMPEYLCIFRKTPQDGDETAAIRHYKSSHDMETKGGGDESQIIDLPLWQRLASPVWFDIRRTDVLNARFKSDNDEKHICPLQLEVIRRGIQLWSNPGEVVFSPFGGIGSEPYTALTLRRRAIAAELKPEYFAQMAEFCAAVVDDNQINLFD